MELRKSVNLAMFLSLAVVLNIVESFIPVFASFMPGIKLGLTNIVILLVLYFYSFKDALFVSILRVFLVGILRTGLFSMSFFFSLGGSILSIIMMYIFKKCSKLSMIGISVIGALSHSIGQIIVAIVSLKNINMVYYLPWLLIFSIPTGILIGVISKQILSHLEKILKKI